MEGTWVGVVAPLVWLIVVLWLWKWFSRNSNEFKRFFSTLPPPSPPERSSPPGPPSNDEAQ